MYIAPKPQNLATGSHCPSMWGSIKLSFTRQTGKIGRSVSYKPQCFVLESWAL